MTKLWRRISYLLRRDRMEAELAEEMEFHREQTARALGGDRAVEGFSLFRGQVSKELPMSVAERRAQRIAQQAFWAAPTKNTRDRATALMHRLLYERMEELGLDFTVLYPTAV
jgi:ParB-like chromosome segregation protein Spo0J